MDKKKEVLFLRPRDKSLDQSLDLFSERRVGIVAATAVDLKTRLIPLEGDDLLIHPQILASEIIAPTFSKGFNSAWLQFGSCFHVFRNAINTVCSDPHFRCVFQLRNVIANQLKFI